MIEGLGHDDGYRMVEDELLTMAGRFTAHLHAAEYHRQKQQAKTRNADTIDTISRPVVGRMTPTVKAKRGRLDKSRNMAGGLRRALANGRDNGVDAESEDDAPWVGTSLQGLMEAPRGSAIRLSRLASVGPGAKAGGSRPDRVMRGSASQASVTGSESRASTRPLHRKRNVPESAEETTDDDDLDTPEPTRRQSARPPHLATTRHAKADRPRSPKRDVAIIPLLSDSDDDLLAGLRKRRQESRAPRGPSRRGNPRPSPSLSSTAARDRGKKPEASHDIIPSFL